MINIKELINSPEQLSVTLQKLAIDKLNKFGDGPSPTIAKVLKSKEPKCNVILLICKNYANSSKTIDKINKIMKGGA